MDDEPNTPEQTPPPAPPAPAGARRTEAGVDALDAPVSLRGALRSGASFLGLTALALLVGVIVAEGGLRCMGLPTGFESSVRAAYDLDGETIGPYRAGARAVIAWPPEIAYECNFNSLGCRGPEPRQVDAPAVLCVGDSLTFGLGVQDDETWPAALDRLLAEAGAPHPVVNLSSAHLLIEDELGYLEGALAKVRPGVVVLLSTPDGYIDPIDQMSRTPHETSRRREQKRRHWLSNLYHGSAIYEARTRARLWRKRWDLVGEGQFPPSLEAPDTLVEMRVRLRDRYRERVGQFRAAVEASGAKLLLVAFPLVKVVGSRIELSPPWTGTLPQALGVAGEDLYATFSRAQDPVGLFLFPYDLHASPRGNALVAQAVLAALRRENLVR